MNTGTEHNGCTPEGKKITVQDLQGIFHKMDYYNRVSGYIAHDLKGNLTFFDSMPSFGGAFVTRHDILTYINEYEA